MKTRAIHHLRELQQLAFDALTAKRFMEKQDRKRVRRKENEVRRLARRLNAIHNRERNGR